MLPHEYFALPRRERAFLIGSVDWRIEQEKKRQREAERQAGSGRGRRNRR